VKADGDQPAGDCLSGSGKGLLALALAEVELSRRRNRDLNYTIGELARHHLIEPGSVEARVVGTHLLEDSLPDGRFENRGFDRTSDGFS